MSPPPLFTSGCYGTQYDGVFFTLGYPFAEPCLTRVPYSKPIQITNVVDLHHLDTDPDADPDAYPDAYPNADPYSDSDFYL